MTKQGALFDERFLERHAGAIMTDTATAIVELVANCWDAYATDVRISWPDRDAASCFAICDNGVGMTALMFQHRWRTFDYNRASAEGVKVTAPSELKGAAPRIAYGRNGRGRHAAFRFSKPYRVRTWRDGIEVVFEVDSTRTKPLQTELIAKREGVDGHGTEILAISPDGVSMTSAQAREIIGSRFLADPSFSVSVDGVRVTFADIPRQRLTQRSVNVHPHGVAHLIFIDTVRADRSTAQHGIAWHVNKRLVGVPSWMAFDQERVLDGRTSEAKRFQVIVQADFLESVVNADWRGFDPESDAWKQARQAVHDAVREYLDSTASERRKETMQEVKNRHIGSVTRLAPVQRNRWNDFVEQVVDKCPSMTPDDVDRVAGILASLELSSSKYALVTKLHELQPGDLDALHKMLEDWTIRLAKDALDEIQSRLKLIEELDRKLRDETLDEVADLQPLFERSLWVFGPEYESLEFTSNRGMTEVIAKLYGAETKGSLLRPDFVMLPDGSVGFYSRDAYDSAGEVNGVARLVVAEIKKVGVTIGGVEKNQPWRYVEELLSKGFVTEATDVSCFVLGSQIKKTETLEDTKLGGKVRIIPMTYTTFIKRAEKRMLGLREKLKDAPFLKEHGIGGDASTQLSSPPHEPRLDLRSPDRSDNIKPSLHP